MKPWPVITLSPVNFVSNVGKFAYCIQQPSLPSVYQFQSHCMCAQRTCRTRQNFPGRATGQFSPVMSTFPVIEFGSTLRNTFKEVHYTCIIPWHVVAQFASRRHREGHSCVSLQFYSSHCLHVLPLKVGRCCCWQH